MIQINKNKIIGSEGEQYIKNFLEENTKYSVAIVGRPFDLCLIDNDSNEIKSYVEVKTTNLYKNNGKNKRTIGIYQCHNKKQVLRIQKEKPYVCFVVEHDNNFLILGFICGAGFPSNKKLSIKKCLDLKLMSPKNFLSII